MPFTLSHPAAVIPINRVTGGRLPLSALVAGSVGPDVVYFLPSGTPEILRHGLVCGVPAGLVTLWVFHAVLKRPLARILPSRWRQRLEPYCGRFAFLPGGRFAVILLAVVFGAITHIAWDSMTHYRGWTVQHVDWYRQSHFRVAGYRMATYFVFKHFSTMLGMLLLGYWSVQSVRRTAQSPHCPRPARRVIAYALILTIAAIGAVALTVVTTELNYGVVSHFVRRVGTGAGGLMLLYCLLYTVLVPDGREEKPA
jgi:hypothetical protein